MTTIDRLDGEKLSVLWRYENEGNIARSKERLGQNRASVLAKSPNCTTSF